MDKTVVSELTAMIAALQSSGQTGFWVLLAVLIAALALGIVAIVCQWIVIGRFKAVETNIKAVETNIKERELGVKERDELRTILNDQFSVVKETNNDLRAEVSRLREQQQGLSR